MTLQAKKIKILLIQKDITQREIADRLGVTPGLVANVINGRHKSRRVKDGIARILGEPDIWNYTPDYQGSVSEKFQSIG